MKKKVIWIIAALVIVTGAILGLTVFKNGKNGELSIGPRRSAAATSKPWS